MKPIAFVLLVIIGLGSQACQHKVKAEDVPVSVRNSFIKNTTHPKNIVWEENPDYYFAYFDEQGEKGMALFSKADNAWLKTEVAVSRKDLTPEQVLLLSNYKNFQIRRLTEVKSKDSSDAIHVILEK